MSKVTNSVARMLIVIIGASAMNAVVAQNNGPMEEVIVWGQGRPVDESHRSSSTVILTADDLVLTYHISDNWDIGGGLRYATKGFQQLDNSDIASEVYGVMDKYTFVNLKTNYRFNEHVRLSLALDNVFNEVAYVNHPYPQRAAFVVAALDF